MNIGFKMKKTINHKFHELFRITRILINNLWSYVVCVRRETSTKNKIEYFFFVIFVVNNFFLP